MKIEVLFPEICNLYGDLANITYLQRCLPEAEIVNTGLKDEPLFAKEEPSLIYMGTTTERGQLLAIEALTPYKERLQELIDNGTPFLITGNALEIFGKEIYEEGTKVTDGLGFINLVAKRKARKRFNALYLGEFEADENQTIDIVGFKSLFGYSYGDDVAKSLFNTKKGWGLNPEIKEEGIRQNNFFATYITGPFLILNPPFTKWFLANIIGVDEPTVAYEDAAMDAYNDRVKEYSDPNTGFVY